ncbi:MAG: AAA family ATPase [bacterium]|nr:AAA family ATPase [bacterium]
MNYKKIPYGISNFEKLTKEDYYFLDKTAFIEELENLGSPYLFFLRPRRFGKSLFISMLQHYYDINQKDHFESLFKETYIGKNPTPLRNSYPVIEFDFSLV